MDQTPSVNLERSNICNTIISFLVFLKRFYGDRVNENKVISRRAIKFTRRHGDTEMTENKIGYLLNFADALMKDEISRIINRQL